MGKLSFKIWASILLLSAVVFISCTSSVKTAELDTVNILSGQCICNSPGGGNNQNQFTCANSKLSSACGNTASCVLQGNWSDSYTHTKNCKNTNDWKNEGYKFIPADDTQPAEAPWAVCKCDTPGLGTNNQNGFSCYSSLDFDLTDPDNIVQKPGPSSQPVLVSGNYCGSSDYCGKPGFWTKETFTSPASACTGIDDLFTDAFMGEVTCTCETSTYQSSSYFDEQDQNTKKYNCGCSNSFNCTFASGQAAPIPGGNCPSQQQCVLGVTWKQKGGTPNCFSSSQTTYYGNYQGGGCGMQCSQEKLQ